MHSKTKTSIPLSHESLKAKHRELRDHHPIAVKLRVHRALSWLGRAKAEDQDQDVRFILLWIGFNAAYAADLDRALTGARDHFSSFFERLVSLDQDQRIYEAVWQRFSNEIRLLLNNKYVFAPFWADQNGVLGNEDWAERLSASQKVVATAVAKHNTPKILSVMFDRLYVLRNQLIHGGATWGSSVNRDQVRDGAAVMSCLLPIFIDIMMDHPEHEWGMPYYPVVE